MSLREIDITSGLYTPGFLIVYGARELNFARDNGYPLSLITFRLDELSSSENPTNSNLNIDIKKLGDKIKKLAGEGSMVARLDNNEIAILLPGVSEEKACGIAKSIRETISDSAEIAANQKLNAIVYGIASTSTAPGEFSELLKASRNAMR